MGETRTSLTNQVVGLLRDESIGHIPFDGITQSLRAALEQYAFDVPRILVTDLAGDGNAFDFSIADLPGYQDGFSVISSIEYPAGGRHPLALDAGEWGMYRSPDGLMVRLGALTPRSGESIRVTYSVAHTIEDLDGATETTILPMHTQAFVYLTAAKAMQMIANKFLHEQETTLDADSVNRSNKSDTARRLIGTMLGLYREIVGVQRGVRPGLLVVDLDTSFAASGLDRLTHPRRRV
jgi:hypothetical protein